MRTAKIIFALVRKNNLQPGFWGSVVLLLCIVMLAISDILHPIPAMVWAGAALWLTVLASAAGAGGFSTDLKHNSMRFLEYLPIRRWHIWIANFGDGLIWILAVGLISSAYRTIHWTPPLPDARGKIEPFTEIIFSGRWNLLLAMLVGPLCTYSISAFYRTIIERDMAAIFRAALGSYLILGALIAFPPYFRVMPAIPDEAIPIAALGLLFAIAGLVMFLFPMTEWRGIFRWGVRSTCVVILYGITIAIFALSCRAWGRYEAAPSDLISSFITDTNDTAYVQIVSRRSGSHLLHVDLNSGRSNYLGRGMYCSPVTGPADSPTPWRELVTDSMAAWELPQRTICSQAADGKLTSLFPLDRISDGENSSFNYRNGMMAVDDKHFIFTGDQGDKAELCVLDQQGRLVRHTPAALFREMMLAKDGRVLIVFDQATSSDPPVALTRLKIYDPRSGETSEREHVGDLIDFAPDLSKALFLESKIDGDMIHDQVTLLDLHSGETRVVIPSDRLSPYPWLDTPDNSAHGHKSVQHGGGGWVGGLAIIVSDDYRQAVWSANLRDAPGTTGLLLLDLSNGNQRVLVSPDDIVERDEHGRKRNWGIGDVMSFTKDGDGVFYEAGTRLFRVRLSDGQRQVIATHAADVQSVTWEFSPDQTHVRGSHSLHDYTGEGQYDPTRVLEVWDSGTCTVLAQGEDLPSSQWLSNGELLLIGKKEITRYDPTTGRRRTVFRVADLH